MRKLAYFFFTLTTISFNLFAQEQTKINGKVLDKTTKEPLPYVSIGLIGSKIGTLTNQDGKFNIITNQKADSLVVSYVGYKTLKRKIKYGQAQHITIELEDQSELFGEVLIKPSENPALKIINESVKNKDKNNPENLGSFKCANYAKTTIALNNISHKLKDSWLFKPLANVLDTGNLLVNSKGQKILPAYCSEVVSEVYYHQNPQKQKEVIVAAKQTGFGVEEDSYLADIMGTMLTRHNLYNNYTTLLGKDFISPIADGCHSIYIYTLVDSAYNYDDLMCYQIRVDLKNPKDLGYTGTILINHQTFALVKVDLRISKESNINFINYIELNQRFEPTKKNAWFLKNSELTLEFEEFEKNTSGFIATFTNNYSKLDFTQKQKLDFFDYPIERLNDATEKTDEYWLAVRTNQNIENDGGFYKQLDSIKNLPVIKSYTDWGHTLLEGNKRIGGFEVGPYTLLASANRVEGFRMRLGFKTNQNFNNNYVLKGFLAYGFKDHKPKYGFGADYILNHKKWTILSANYRNDYDILGVSGNSIFSNLFNNNFFQAFNFFSPKVRLNHTKEINFTFASSINSNLSYKIIYNNQYFKPLGNFIFAYNTEPENPNSLPKNNFTNTSLGLELRWAYKEINVTRGIDRVKLERAKLPEITLRYEHGLQVFNGNFEYDKVLIALRHRMNTGVFGTANWWIYGGKIFGKLPYPLLDVARGNQSFIYSEVNYSLMDFYEFVSDAFIHASYTQRLEGLFLNRIPLIKKLDWRSLIIVKMAYGNLSNDNVRIICKKDLENHPVMQVNSFGKLPYTEVGYGFENIFHFFQIFAFHRLNYLNTPKTRRFGINIGLKIQF